MAALKEFWRVDSRAQLMVDVTEQKWVGKKVLRLGMLLVAWMAH